MKQKLLTLRNSPERIANKNQPQTIQAHQDFKAATNNTNTSKHLQFCDKIKMRNNEYSNVSQCSTCFEDDLFKSSPKKCLPQQKQFCQIQSKKSLSNKGVYKLQSNKKVKQVKQQIISIPVYKTQTIPIINNQKNDLNLQTKTIKKILESRKNSNNLKLDADQIKRPKIFSQLVISKSQEHFKPLRVNQHLSSKSKELAIYESQVLALKGSKQLNNELIQQKHHNIKLLKETVSTNSSNKISKELKISDFELGKDLGKGKFGCVRIAKHKKTGMLFSIKIINKQMIKQQKIIDQLIKQIKIQSFLNHSHIVKLYSTFDDKEYVYLLMELCAEGNLYEYMQSVGKISQKQASQFMKETCQAVSELHFNKIIHRDIKPENIVLCFGMVKICDFGWSTQIKGSMRETFCGSPLYISPQLLKGQLYDEKVDLWALGILGYQMLTGSIPFDISTQRDLRKIVHQRVAYPKWMSEETISFLSQLLDKNPNGRTNVEDLLSHPFLNNQK